MRLRTGGWRRLRTKGETRGCFCVLKRTIAGLSFNRIERRSASLEDFCLPPARFCCCCLSVRLSVCMHPPPSSLLPQQGISAACASAHPYPRDERRGLLQSAGHPPSPPQEIPRPPSLPPRALTLPACTPHSRVEAPPRGDGQGEDGATLR